MKRVKSRAKLDRHLQYVCLEHGETAYMRLQGRAESSQRAVYLLLHGFTTNTYTLLPFAEEMVAAQLPFRELLMFDFYGGGRSATPAGVRLTEEVFVRQTMQVLEALEVPRVVIVGNSMGAVVASALACRAPHLVERLVLIGPGGIPITTGHLVRSPSLCAARLLFHLGRAPAGIGRLVVGCCGLVIRYVLPYVVPHHAMEAVEEWNLQIRVNDAFLDGVHSALSNFSFYCDMSGMYAKLAASGLPVMLVWGAEDKISPPFSICHLLPLADCTVLNSLGHSPQYENPRATLEVIKSFLLKPSRGGEIAK